MQLVRGLGVVGAVLMVWAAFWSFDAWLDGEARISSLTFGAGVLW